MLKKNEVLLRQLEGLTDEECIQWFMKKYGAIDSEAALHLAVARGENVYGDILYTDSVTRRRRFDIGARPNGRTGLLREEILEETQDMSEEEAVQWYMTAYACPREQAVQGLREAHQPEEE